MGQTLLAAVTSGLALAGVLAVAGAGAGRVSRPVPHLGIGGLGAAMAVLAARLPLLVSPFRLFVVAVVAAAVGCAGGLLDRRARAVEAPVWPPALLAEVAVLGLALGLAGLLRPASAIDLPLGPLGGLSSMAAAVAACITGIVLAVVVGARPVARRELMVWAVAVAGTAVAVTLGAGGVAINGGVFVPAFGVPDVAGIALRAAAVGAVARLGTWRGIAAALALGLVESALRSLLSTGETALLPAILVLGWAVWRDGRQAPATAAA